MNAPRCAYGPCAPLPPPLETQPLYWRRLWRVWWWGWETGDQRKVEPELELVRVQLCRDLIQLLGLSALGAPAATPPSRLKAALERAAELPPITVAGLMSGVAWDMANALSDAQEILDGANPRDEIELATRHVAQAFGITLHREVEKTEPPAPPTPREIPF